jgi:hypothetical protein
VNTAIMAPDGFRSNLAAVHVLLQYGPALMTNAEFVVLLYHVERITLMGRETDQHSGRQAGVGIYRNDVGRWVRGPCGVGATTWTKANRALIAKGFVRTYDLRLKRHDGIEYEVLWPAIAKAIAAWKRARCAEMGLFCLEIDTEKGATG